jgi:hypothetical protein
VANYNFVCNSTAAMNYSSCSDTVSYNVNQGAPTINITFNTSDTVTQYTVVNISCNNPSEISVGLYNNTSGASLSNPYIYNATQMGIRNFSCNSTGNANYSAADTTKSLTVTSASGIAVYVYNEENTSQGLTFNITMNNGTTSDTAYNQNNPYLNTSITGLITVDIWNTDYPQRTYYLSQGSNSTTLNAYLLASGSGSYVLFYTYTSTEQPIQSALINVERLIPPSSWLTIAQKKTDSSGSLGIFLSPTTTYRFNVSATGYANQSFQLQPTASPYIIYMTSASGSINITYATLFQNLSLQVYPADAGLVFNQTYPFFYYINSTDSFLEYYGWRISFGNGTTITQNNTTGTAGYNISYLLDTGLWNGNITMNYWFKKQNYTLFNNSLLFRVYNVTPTNTSIMRLADDIKTGAATVTSDEFAMIAILFTIIIMAGASSQFKMFGSGVIGIGILAIFSSIGTYIYGSAYLMGWGLWSLFTLGVIAAIWIRGGFG